MDGFLRRSNFKCIPNKHFHICQTPLSFFFLANQFIVFEFENDNLHVVISYEAGPENLHKNGSQKHIFRM